MLTVWFHLNDNVYIDIRYWPIGILAGILGLTANLLFLLSLRISQISMVIPILGLVPIISAFSGYVLLDEKLELKQIIGIILSGLALVIIYSPPKSNIINGIKFFIKDKGAVLMGIVAILWAILAPIDKICMQYSSDATHALLQTIFITLALFFYLTLFKKNILTVIKLKALVPAILGSLTAGIAYSAQLIAYQLTYVSFVELYKRIVGILGALITGRIFLAEAITRKKIFGILMMMASLPLVMLDF